jgi:uncharacterized protein
VFNPKNNTSGGTEMMADNITAKQKIIPAHLFKHGGKYFMFDSSTLFSFEIDEVSYNVVKEYYLKTESKSEDLSAKYGDDAVQAAIKDIDALIEKKFFQDESDKEYSSAANRSISTIELNIIHSCNMNCIYCYGEGGNYGSEEKCMDIETAKRSVDFLIENSGDIKELCLVFFGGEPLMNAEVMFETAQYAKEACRKKEKEIVFTMTTNGTLLDKDTVKKLGEHGIRFMMSMDGGKKEQDFLRPLRNGESSYSRIEPAMNELRDKLNVTARSTITKANLDLLSLVEEFKKLGFKGCHFTTVNTANKNLALDEQDYTHLMNQYDIMTEDILESIRQEKIPGFKIKDIFTVVDRLYSAQRRLLPCGAGKNMMCVSPEGNLYLCHRFAENEEYNLGNIVDGIDWERKDLLSSPLLMKDENCRKCWIRSICAGGCWHSRLDNATNQLLETIPLEYECNLRRHIYELSMVVYNEIMEHDGLMERLKGKNAAKNEDSTIQESKPA